MILAARLFAQAHAELERGLDVLAGEDLLLRAYR